MGLGKVWPCLSDSPMPPYVRGRFAPSAHLAGHHSNTAVRAFCIDASHTSNLLWLASQRGVRRERERERAQAQYTCLDEPLSPLSLRLLRRYPAATTHKNTYSVTAKGGAYSSSLSHN